MASNSTAAVKTTAVKTTAATAAIRHVAAVEPAAAEGLTAELYQQAKFELGVIGSPITMLSPAPELHAPLWSLLRESLLVGGPAERTAKEVVATTIAVKNRCTFCTDAHSMMLHAAGEHDLAEGLRIGEPPPEWAELAAWAVDPRADGPFPAEAAPRFIGTALVFEIVTRLVKVLAANASPHPVTATKLGRTVASRRVRDAVAAELDPGLSLPLLAGRPEWLEELWPTLDPTIPAWAGDSPVGLAWAQLRAVAACGRGALSDQAANAVEDAIEASLRRSGTRPGPVSLAGIDALPEREALGARLAAAAALDPASVTDADVSAWRSGEVDDHDTVFMFTYAVAHLADGIQNQLHSQLHKEGTTHA
ncbi:carboxymuconolactone decarboxylase family protein [Glycomyces buryatensis]|uniref:DNA-binding protein n=1 Tax=Glycomyces buryatensis TaxID=2570927 RepID=A0A4S8QDB5_9ACTN|nr:carboxymuconolactone decarboxylase family protein [Glycomyces buryatensis]THV41611.1 DNA-binding protein [Glycomyces buryatensis]